MPQAEAWRQARPRPAASSSSSRRRRGGFDLAALLQHLEQNPPGGSPWITLGVAALLWCGAVLLTCRLLDVIT
ncbi:hypothetical protein JMJ55_26830 [Belnapia sp. T6]|uniref:Uncharacterized protein n=1 Tax=Belnapia mucosa TaxID=2804532 RepID=A0ABS1VB92_9PROT|nr:hypothetical protein [Belnapia mucosa]MBL6458949.1 hypothetical protein [Belnapia mucosa]